MIRWLRRWLGSASTGNSSTSAPAPWFVEWIRGDQDGESGISIDGKSALKYAPVWYAVRRISGHVAQLPLVLYEQLDERSKRRATDHPAYTLVKRRPNAFMTASIFRELLQYHALLWGNGRAAITRNLRGDPLELIPLLPDRTITVLVNGAKWHVTTIVTEDGRREQLKFRDENVLHIAGLGFDGIVGYPLWELARGSWGLGLAAEKHGNRFYKNNAVPGLILEAPPGVFPDEQEAKKFLQAFRSMHEGTENSHRTALLREGIKVSKLSFTPEEAQAIETRQFQRQEVALWFLLEAITGDDKSVSYSSLEQKHLAYLVNCLNGWLVKWQEQCEAKLLRPRELAADSHYFRFSTGALLRSDMRTTYETLAGGVRGMLITINEARAVLDLDAIEGGDVLLNPAITPGSPAPAPPLPPDPAQDRLRAVIAARLEDLAGVERQRLETALSRPRPLRDWGEEFYARWRRTVVEAMTPLSPAGVSPETVADAWCQAGHTALGAPDPRAAWNAAHTERTACCLALLCPTSERIDP